MDDRPKFDLAALEPVKRWTEQADEASIFTRRYLDCDACGGTPRVVRGRVAHGVVDRQLACGCGRSWRQLIH